MAVDVHEAPPAGCRSCAMQAGNRACLEHTCPDCGEITHAETNERGELTHECPDATCPDCGEAPCHPQCLRGGGL